MSAAVLAEIGDALAVLRPSTCAVLRSTAVDANGAPTGGSPTTVETVSCRVDPPSTRAVETAFGPRLASTGDALISVPRGTDVTNTDQIDATTDGVTTRFNVVNVPVGSHLAEIPVLCQTAR